MTRPDVEARFVDDARHLADCDGRRALAVTWADEAQALITKLRKGVR